MTDKDAAEAEIKATLQWFSNESDRLCEEFQAKLGSEYKIDDPRNRIAFKELHGEFARRMAAIGKKYNLLPK